MLKDFSALVCCPVCRKGLLRKKEGYFCEKDGLFIVDEFNRPFLIKKDIFELNSEEHESGINWLKSFLKQFPVIYYGIWHIFCPVLMVQNGPKKMFPKIPKKDAIMLDVGSGPERFDKQFINLDVFPFPEVDIVADAASLPFKNESVDVLVSESLLEHVPNPNKVAEEMTRVLKRGGLIYISAPFIHPYHASPDDFNRWSISGLKALYPELDIIESGVRSGPWSAFLMFFVYWLGVIFSLGYKKAAPFLTHFFMLFIGPFKFLDLIFLKFPGAEAVSAHLYIIGKRK